MPNTETIELRTDTIEQLVELLQYDLVTTNPPMNRDRRKAVAERLRSEIDRPDAVALAGLPGAGKSYTAEKLGEVYDTQVVSMGDAIRAHAPPQARSSDQLGKFAAETREERAETIPEWVVGLVDDDADVAIIDGVRSVTDYTVLNDYFDQLGLIEVKTNFYDRLDRIQHRGREGEESFTAIDLAERDDRELYELGLYELRGSGNINQELRNDPEGEVFTNTLSRLVENQLPYDIENGKPLGLDEELEQIRQEVTQ